MFGRRTLLLRLLLLLLLQGIPALLRILRPMVCLYYPNPGTSSMMLVSCVLGGHQAMVCQSTWQCAVDVQHSRCLVDECMAAQRHSTAPCCSA